MNIIFVIDQVYLHGGIERVLSIKANFLANQKANNIYIITSEQKGNSNCYEFSSNIHFQDLSINYNRSKSFFHPKNLVKIPLHIFKIKKAIKKIKPEVIIMCSHSTDTYFMPFIAKKIPKVKEFHFSKSTEALHRINGTNFWKSYFYKFSDFVESKYDTLVVLNKDEVSYFKTNNTIIIPNPLTFFPNKVSKLSQPIAIAAGRIAPVKQFEVLIDIWEEVSKKNSSWKLFIYGSGDPMYIELLQERINIKKLSNQVFLKEATSNIQNKMLSSSLFVMTSKNECFPLVLLEAQACGLPIIAFDCPHGPRNIVMPNNGILIKPGHIFDFANNVLDLMNKSEKRINFGEHAREHASNFSIEKIMSQWSVLLNDLKKKYEKFNYRAT